MVASLGASAFFPSLSLSSNASAKSAKCIGNSSQSLGVQGIVVAKPTSSSGALEVKEQAQTLPNINGTKDDVKIDGQKVDEDFFSTPRTSYNQLPDLSILFAVLTPIFLAAEKQWTSFDWRQKQPEMLADAVVLGKIVQDGLVFRQNFLIRSYEIGADGTASIETLMKHLQETALNHVRIAGLLGDGFGSTPEMCKRDLIWVVTKMQVAIEHYPAWEDIIQVDTWVAAAGKNGMRRSWHVYDYRTNRTILKASSVWVMMNKHTRRLSKMPEEVRAEIGPHFFERVPVVEDDSRKLPKLENDTADYVGDGLTPRWADLDINQHVNNVKYVGWILESVPISIFESRELASLTMEYRRECGRDSVLQSLTAVSAEGPDGSIDNGIECQHLLRLEYGDEILRGRTRWRPKPVNDSPKPETDSI